MLKVLTTSIIIISVYLAIFMSIYRFNCPSMSETQLFINMYKAFIFDFTCDIN
jgi:hypothetical protein